MQLKKFLLYSVIVHTLVASLLLLLTRLENNSAESEAIEVAFIDNSDKEKSRQNPLSVVDSDSQAANNKLDKNAKYLSEKSNTVEKETRAKTGMKFVNSRKAQQARAKSAAQIFENGFDAYGAMVKKANAGAEKKAMNGSTEESTTNDNLKNAENDLITRLNTKEYKYYGYYSRIKTQLNQWWVPKVQQKFTNMLRQGRSIASDENKVTKLVIVLNDAGNLVRVQVLGESGVRDLDDAAIEAFRQAAPFPNPPKGMIDSDGTVKIRWDCVVES
jgi:protein TonB